MCVGELDFVSSFEVFFIRPASADCNEVVFSNFKAVDFRNELDLLFGVIVQGYRLTQGIEVVV